LASEPRCTGIHLSFLHRSFLRFPAGISPNPRVVPTGVWPGDEAGTLVFEPLGGEAMYIGIGTVLVILLILIIIGVLR